MKRLIVFALLLVLLTACSVDTSGNADIRQAADVTNAFTDYTVKFRSNMTFYNEQATLLFAQGWYTAHKGDSTSVVAEMTQTVLGTPSTVKVEYTDGNEITTIDGEAYQNQTTDDEFFGRMIYSGVTVFADEHIKKISQSTVTGGTMYELTLKNADAVLLGLLDENLYELAAILKPQKDLIRFENARAQYVITTDDITYISAATVEFTVFLYDTPPYNPAGKTEKLEDYMLELRVTLALEFTTVP